MPEMKQKYIAELEKGVWIAPWDGDPGRTVVKRNAATFTQKLQAWRAIKKAREYRPFINAEIVPI
jgi:hypothetical protein